MKISTKSRYGLRSVYILGTKEGEIVPLNFLSQEIGVGSSYLEQLLRKLKKAGIVDSVRGVSGGYILAKPSTEIKIGEVMRALEDGLEIADCAVNCEKDKADIANVCPARKIFATMYDAINKRLDEITLYEMLEDEKTK